MTTFDHLPTEIHQQIARNLPPRSAFNLILVCRRIRDSYVNDGAVWRDIVASELNLSPTFLSSNPSDVETWKRYAIADLKVDQITSPITENPVRWLSQMMALHHPILLTIEPRELYPFSDPINHTADNAIQALTNSPHPIRISRNPKSEIPIEIWRSSQAASFCFSSRLLTYHLSPFSSEEKAQESLKHFPPLLYTILWFVLDFSDPNILGPFNGYKMARLGFMMHTFANRAVGYFAMQVRSALAHKRTFSGDVNGCSFPPTAFDIPFSSFMKLPTPFHKDFLWKFACCHVENMLEQTFLEDGEWTGYFSMGFENPREMDPSNDKFDPIGGDNEVVRDNGWGVLNPVYPGKIVDHVVRFKVVERLGTGGNFRLKSNFFQSQEDTHVLEAIVFRDLGYMIFDHQNCAWERKKEITAVITPFGIVGCAVGGTSWMWLWKSAWSASS